MAESIISTKTPRAICRRGNGAEIIDGAVKIHSSYSPELLVLNSTQYTIGFCHFYNTGKCENPYGKNEKGDCPFPGKNLPVFATQNEASEALMQRHRELQAIADGK